MSGKGVTVNVPDAVGRAIGFIPGLESTKVGEAPRASGGGGGNGLMWLVLAGVIAWGWFYLGQPTSTADLNAPATNSVPVPPNHGLPTEPDRSADLRAQFDQAKADYAQGLRDEADPAIMRDFGDWEREATAASRNSGCSDASRFAILGPVPPDVRSWQAKNCKGWVDPGAGQ